MPELPEVETVVRTLEKQIKNETIKEVIIYYPRIIEGDSDYFKKELVGKTFKEFTRRGKYLHFIFQENSMYCHLRMEGKFYVVDSLEELDMKHVHLAFKFESGRYLCYHDVRKFGRMYYVKDGETIKEIQKLGYEPFDKNLTGEVLMEMLQKSKGNIKEFLLDQTKIVGIGNIYACEICYVCKLHPELNCKEITIEQANAIIGATQDILSRAIEAGGTTIRSYTSSLGVTGKFQLNVGVYGKENEPCGVCGTTIQKMVLGGRGTYYCPKCQRR